MTNADKWQEERRLDDERCVDGLLAEAGLPDDAELRAVLLELRNLRAAEVPEPSAELAALLGKQATPDVIRLEDWPRKRPGRKRVIFTTLAVAASLGVAGGAAAGNDTLRSKAEGTIDSIVSSFFPPPPVKPAPSSPSPAPKPAKAPAPAPPAVVLPSPAGTAPAPEPTAERSAGEGRKGAQEPPHERQAQNGKATGRDAAVTGMPAQPGASPAAEVPSPTKERPAHDPPSNNRPANGISAGGRETPGIGNANGKTRNDVGTGPGADQPKAPPAKGSGR
jgi:hypothetical protein